MSPDPFTSLGPDAYSVRLGTVERRLLDSLLADLEVMLQRSQNEGRTPHGDPAVAPLFPTTHPDDDEAELEHRELMGSHPVTSRLESLATTRNTVDHDQLSEEELASWLQSLNALRVILARRMYSDPAPAAESEGTQVTSLEALAGYQAVSSDTGRGSEHSELARLQAVLRDTGASTTEFIYRWLSDLLGSAVEALSGLPADGSVPPEA